MKIVTFFESLKIGWWVEKVQTTIWTGLYERGYDVIYLVLEDRTPRNEYKWTIVSLEEKFIFGFWIRKILSLFKLGKRVSEFCKNEKVDIILGQGDFFYMVVAISKWLYANPAKCIWVVHTTIGIWSPIIKKALIFLLKKLDFIILISHAEEKRFLDKYGFSREKCKVIYNSLDTKDIEEKKKLPIPEDYSSLFSSDRFTFINIGRCTYQKNHSLLLQAFEEVHKTYLNTQLVILGQWELRENLEKEKDMLTSKEDIHFLGNQENIYPFLMKSDCFVLSSRFEWFWVVLLEAMAIWIPIISTDCPTGPSEVLSYAQDHVKMIQNENTQELISAMAMLPKKWKQSYLPDEFLNPYIMDQWDEFIVSLKGGHISKVSPSER